jgi:hypothetical protein
MWMCTHCGRFLDDRGLESRVLCRDRREQAIEREAGRLRNPRDDLRYAVTESSRFAVTEARCDRS